LAAADIATQPILPTRIAGIFRRSSQEITIPHSDRLRASVRYPGSDEVYAMKAQPLIAVRDVERSSHWYRQLLGCQSGHGGNEYEQIVKDGEMILQLHAWDVHGHPSLCNPGAARHGFGVLLWFQLSAFDAAVEQARALGATILEEPHVNARANHRECWIKDPDDYVVVLAGNVGDVG
jgi:catechol 2,3-dioxygenase-like lactoylglutathione lyase family enzyme